MMSKKLTDVVAYLSWIGLIIAFVAGDRENCKFHLNQSLVIWLAGIVLGVVAIVPILGWLVAFVGWIFLVVCWFIGIISAASGTEKEIPLLGRFKLLQECRTCAIQGKIDLRSETAPLGHWPGGAAVIYGRFNHSATVVQVMGKEIFGMRIPSSSMGAQSTVTLMVCTVPGLRLAGWV